MLLCYYLQTDESVWDVCSNNIGLTRYTLIVSLFEGDQNYDKKYDDILLSPSYYQRSLNNISCVGCNLIVNVSSFYHITGFNHFTGLRSLQSRYWWHAVGYSDILRMYRVHCHRVVQIWVVRGVVQVGGYGVGGE